MILDCQDIVALYKLLDCHSMVAPHHGLSITNMLLDQHTMAALFHTCMLLDCHYYWYDYDFSIATD
jgi:hypothetical protein